MNAIQILHQIRFAADTLFDELLTSKTKEQQEVALKKYNQRLKDLEPHVNNLWKPTTN